MSDRCAAIRGRLLQSAHIPVLWHASHILLDVARTRHKNGHILLRFQFACVRIRRVRCARSRRIHSGRFNVLWIFNVGRHRLLGHRHEEFCGDAIELHTVQHRSREHRRTWCSSEILASAGEYTVAVQCARCGRNLLLWKHDLQVTHKKTARRSIPNFIIFHLLPFQILSSGIQDAATGPIRCRTYECNDFFPGRGSVFDQSSGTTFSHSHHTADHFAARTETYERLRYDKSVHVEQCHRPIHISPCAEHKSQCHLHAEVLAFDQHLPGDLFWFRASGRRHSADAIFVTQSGQHHSPIQRSEYAHPFGHQPHLQHSHQFAIFAKHKTIAGESRQWTKVYAQKAILPLRMRQHAHRRTAQKIETNSRCE